MLTFCSHHDYPTLALFHDVDNAVHSAVVLRIDRSEILFFFTRLTLPLFHTENELFSGNQKYEFHDIRGAAFGRAGREERASTVRGSIPESADMLAVLLCNVRDTV